MDWMCLFASKGSGRTRRKFTPEFKAVVVAMVEASGGKIAQVAREMRLHDSSVGNWVHEAREAKAGQAPTAVERAEIRELKAELERVSRERDILGKAGMGGAHGGEMKSCWLPLVDVGSDWCFAPAEKLDAGALRALLSVASSTNLRLV
jgi:transposase